jgi:hypothetical protein
MLWRDSKSRPIAPVSSMAGGNDTPRPRRQGNIEIITSKSRPYDVVITSAPATKVVRSNTHQGIVCKQFIGTQHIYSYVIIYNNFI